MSTISGTLIQLSGLDPTIRCGNGLKNIAINFLHYLCPAILVQDVRRLSFGEINMKSIKFVIFTAHIIFLTTANSVSRLVHEILA
jgi:hypothetical protein